MIEVARKMILDLLTQGAAFSALVTDEMHPREGEKIATHVSGYLAAAQALLASHVELHNEMIDHPGFVALRRFARKYR